MNQKFKTKFGDKEFVKEYWRLIIPVMFFGLFFSLGPMLLATTFSSLIPNNASVVRPIFGYGNYLIQLYWYFGIAFVFAASPVIGNYIKKGNIQDIHSLLRVVFVNLILINTIFFIFLESLTGQIIEGFFQIKASSASFPLYLNDIRILGVNTYLYSMAYILIISIAPFRMIKNNLFASLWTFSFYILTTTLFLYTANYLQLGDMAIIEGLASLYILSLLVFYFYFLILSKRKYIFWIKKINNKGVRPYDDYALNFTNKSISAKQVLKTKTLELWIIPNPVIVLDFWSSGKKIDFHKLKEMWSLGWAIFIDESLWVLANLVFEILAVSIKGAPGSGWSNYKAVIIVQTLISASVYAILDGWIILPQHFVTTELGKNNRVKAKQYGDQLINWSIVVGLILVVVYMMIGLILSFTNTKVHVDSMIMFGFVIIFSFTTVFINSIYQTIASLLTVGGSRWIQFANSFITIINSFAVIVPLAISINNGRSVLASGNLANLYGYYTITRIYVFFKLAVGLTLWKSNKGLNSIDTLKINHKQNDPILKEQ